MTKEIRNKDIYISTLECSYCRLHGEHGSKITNGQYKKKKKTEHKIHPFYEYSSRSIFMNSCPKSKQDE